MLQASDWIIIICAIILAVLGITYYMGRRNQKKSYEAHELLDQYRMVTPILVIDKKYEKPSPSNMPQKYYDNIPKKSRMKKMCILKAKVGPQITTLFCDKNVYDVLTTGKTYEVELSGSLILSIPGMNLADKKDKTFREKMAVKGEEIRKNNPNV